MREFRFEAMMEEARRRQENLEIMVYKQENQISHLLKEIEILNLKVQHMEEIGLRSNDEGSKVKEQVFKEEVKEEDLSFTVAPQTLITIVRRVLGLSLGGGKAVYVGMNLIVIQFADVVEHEIGERVNVCFPFTGKAVTTVVIKNVSGGCDALVVEGQGDLPDAFDLDILLEKKAGRVMIVSVQEDGSTTWSTGVYTEDKKFKCTLSEVSGTVRKGDAVFTCRDGIVRLVGVVEVESGLVDNNFYFLSSRIEQGKWSNADVLEPLGIVYVPPVIKYDYCFGPDD